MIVLVSERAEARRAEEEVPACAGLEPEPPARKHAQKVSTREQQRVAVDGAHAADHAVGPGSDLIGRLSVRGAIAEQLPVRALGMDLGARATLVRAVIPLDEVGLDFRHGAEAGELTCSDRSPQGAREHRRERQPMEPLSQPCGLGFAMRGERKVASSRVLMGYGPGRLAVPCQIYNWKCAAHQLRPPAKPLDCVTAFDAASSTPGFAHDLDS